jgi:inosine/xanthosine triphosphatase
MKIKVAVGSMNPVKIDCVKLAFTEIWPNKEFVFIGTDVKSGVSNQPMSDIESLKGATNRAKRSLKATNADFGVGLEGGIQQVGKIWLEYGTIVVIDNNNIVGIGSSPRLLVPRKAMKLMLSGIELGEVSDILFNRKNSKHQEGFFGLMTNNLITRTDGYKYCVIMALSRFLHPELF